MIEFVMLNAMLEKLLALCFIGIGVTAFIPPKSQKQDNPVANITYNYTVTHNVVVINEKAKKSPEFDIPITNRMKEYL